MKKPLFISILTIVLFIALQINSANLLFGMFTLHNKTKKIVSVLQENKEAEMIFPNKMLQVKINDNLSKPMKIIIQNSVLKAIATYYIYVSELPIPQTLSLILLELCFLENSKLQLQSKRPFFNIIYDNKKDE